MQNTGSIPSSEWTKPSLSEGLGDDYNGHNMVFILGCGRSGTTWLQRLLASHPKVRTGQETGTFTTNIGPQLRAFRREAAPNAQTLRPDGLGCYFTEDEFCRILKGYLLKLLEPMVTPLAADELFLEKTPNHGEFIPEIFEFLPRARVIHMLRDARDVVSSMLAKDGCIPRSNWAPSGPIQASFMWVNMIKAIRKAVANVSPDQFHEVRYETLSRSPVEVLQGCADFLGLDWDRCEIAEAVEANRASKARASGGGTPIPLRGEVAKRFGNVVVEPKGFIRKATPGSWKKDLSLYQKFRVWRSAHQTMEEVGYDWPKGMEFAFSSLSASLDLSKQVLSPGSRLLRGLKR